MQYVHGLGLVSRADDDGRAFFGFDGAANTVQVTDAAGQCLNRYSYLPFGEPLVAAETLPVPFRFVGALGVMDHGGGGVLMRRRAYDPGTGRFAQRDPLGVSGDPGGLYGYVGNNPLTGVDPSGLDEDAWASVVNGVVLPTVSVLSLYFAYN